MDMRLHTRNAIPDRAVLVLALIMAATLVSIGVYRATGHGPVSPAVLAAVHAQVQLHFEDQSDGTIDVIDADTGQRLATLAYGEDGFVRSTMRGLARARKQQGQGPAVPFRLARHGDGHYTLKDPVTRRTIHLRAFGSTNEAAFGRFLEASLPPAADGPPTAAAAPPATTDPTTDQG